MIKTIVVDDQEKAVEIMTNHISKCDELTLVFSTIDPNEALKFVKSNEVDLIFLDIQMPEVSGIDFMDILSSTHQKMPYIVITTGYDQYAISGYDYGAIDYIVKPIMFSRFRKSVDRVISQFNMEQKIEIDYLLIDKGRIKNKVYYQEIDFIESFPRNCVTIHTTEGEITTRGSLGAVMEKLPSHQFYRVSASFIVPIHKVTSFSMTHLVLNYNEKMRIPLGIKYRDEILEKLGSNN